MKRMNCYYWLTSVVLFFLGHSVLLGTSPTALYVTVNMQLIKITRH